MFFKGSKACCSLHVLVTLSVMQLYASNLNSNGNQGYFWHITDIHFDANYSISGDPKNLCHLPTAGLTYENGKFGNYMCDSPLPLVNLTLAAMRKIYPKPDFILWTGDNLPHTRRPYPNWFATFSTLNNITDYLRKSFPNIPIYTSIGNHDTFPPNVLNPEYDSNSSIYDDYLVKGGWNMIIPESSWSTFSSGGFYSTKIVPGLKMISLNTILWYESNPAVQNETDPSAQLQWLERELENASISGEKVFIIGHVPPGYYNMANPGEVASPLYYPQYSERFLNIIRNYSYTILGQFYGHLHIDMFQLYFYNAGQALGSGFLSASITPWYSGLKRNENVSVPVNPTVRLFHYNQENFSLLDFDQYYLNLTKANSNDGEAAFEKLYSFIQAYGVPDLSTKSLVSVYEKLKSSSACFKIFYKYLTGAKQHLACDAHCKRAQLCSIAHVGESDYVSCMKENGHYENNSLIMYITIPVVFLLVAVVIAYFIWWKKKRHIHFLSYQNI